MLFPQSLIGPAGHQGGVPAADEDVAFKVLQGALGTLDGVAGAQLGALVDPGIAGEGSGDFLLLIAHHQHDIFGRKEVQGLQHITEQGPACGQTEDLGQIHPLGAQPGALSGGQNDGFQRFIHG